MRGSIRKVQRKNGHKWRVEIDLPHGVREKRKRKTKIFDLKREAEKWLAKINHRIQNGDYVEPSDQPLGEFLDHFLEEYCQHNVSENTLSRYRGGIRRHIKPELGDIPLKDITPMKLQTFYHEKLENGKINREGGLAGATVRGFHNILHKALKLAVRWELIKTNPADAVDPPKPAPAEQSMNYLSSEQTARFLEACDTQEWYGPILKTAVLTGLRMEELRGIRWQDLNKENQTVAIVEVVVTTQTGEDVIKEPKSAGSRRTVSIPERTLQILNEWKKQQHKQRMEIGPEWEKENDRIFTTRVGTSPNPSNLRRALKNVLNQADLPDIRFHDLRHTHASVMLEQGIHPKVVAERLGHSSVRITLDRYSHALPNIQEDAAQAIEDTLFEDNSGAKTG